MCTSLRVKKIIFLFLWIGVIVCLLWAVPVVVHHRIQAELRNAFKDARVTVGKFGLERPIAVGLSDIRIEADGYRIHTPKAVAFFSGRVEVRDLVIDLKLPEVKGQIRGFLEYDLRTREAKSARLQTPSLKSGKLKITNILLDLPGSGATGALTAERLTLEKFRVSDFKSEVVREGTRIDVRVTAASWAKGSIMGGASLRTQDPFSYEADLEIRELDLDAFTEEMKLQNKMTADGKLAGKISVRGDRTGIGALQGRLNAGSDGGNLVIQDPNFLKYLADNAGQPIALVEAAFKEYHFDAGSVTLEKSDRKLGFEVSLTGAKGRRDFEVNLHDVL